MDLHFKPVLTMSPIFSYSKAITSFYRFLTLTARYFWETYSGSYFIKHFVSFSWVYKVQLRVAELRLLYYSIYLHYIGHFWYLCAAYSAHCLFVIYWEMLETSFSKLLEHFNIDTYFMFTVVFSITIVGGTNALLLVSTNFARLLHRYVPFSPTRIC